MQASEYGSQHIVAKVMIALSFSNKVVCAYSCMSISTNHEIE